MSEIAVFGQLFILENVRNRGSRSVIGIKAIYAISVRNFYTNILFVTCDYSFEISEIYLKFEMNERGSNIDYIDRNVLN